MRVAAIQMNSGDGCRREPRDWPTDLLGRRCSGRGELAVLPENFALMPRRGRDKAAHAERPGEGRPIQEFLSAAISTATRALDRRRQYAARVTGGRGTGIRRLPGRTTTAARGKAIYRKIHLFDVDLVGQQASHIVSPRSMYPGDEAECASTTPDSGRIGLTICYDLRFPELYRRTRR